MKVLLTILDRITLVDILPTQGNYANMKLVREMKERLSFNEEDHDAFGIKILNNNGSITTTWNLDLDTGVDFEIGSRIEVMIKDELNTLNADSKLTDAQCILYEKFNMVNAD